MISFEAVTLRRGSRVLFEDASFALHDGQHAGLTGANGCGKSSLFALLLGELGVDAGEVRVPAGLRIAHMAQEVEYTDRAALDYVIDGDRELRHWQDALARAEAAGDDHAVAAAHAEIDQRDGYNAHFRAGRLLHGLGFANDDGTRPVNAFSGGWRIRLNLARALMCPSDLLLLDEPSNHLDLDATDWLEGWLKRYRGTLLVISHDRDFLDGTVDTIVHIEHQAVRAYRGNYSAFEVQRAERLAQQQALHDKQQARIKSIEAFVARFRAKATKARQAQSRLKELARMPQVEAAHVDSPFDFRIREADKVSDPLLVMDRVALGYDGRRVLDDVRVNLHPGARIGLLGANGAGKSTLIKGLTGALAPLAGARTAGTHLACGYYDQQQLEALDLDASALTHLRRLSPRATEQDCRDFLGGFDFHGDAALGPIRPMSGGEKARLALALIAWQRPNLLLLDEPTNHLDLDMRHALTVALQAFGGALVVVSHDRYLLRHSVDEFWLVADGRVTPFDGDLDDYHRYLAGREAAASVRVEARPARDARAERRDAAERRARLAPLKKDVARLEQAMDGGRAALAGLQARLADSALYAAGRTDELQQLLREQGALQQALATQEEAWLEAQEALETLAAELDLDP
ncbi:MAG: ATP-binding cassette domain-containing protein [Gammaproteobacteria bacterium]|nr:ATP-binding cassette domain-containing protein [Gammaproteobacteria bacterium]MCP5201135.1 ATP-binding cassette domain-containing protein [Gammaproteobacteria bacterium]